MQELNAKSVIVSAKGGTLDYVSTNDGEHLFSVAVPPGKVPAREYLDLLPPGAEIQVADGLAVINPRSWYGVQAYGAGSHDTGANPDFAPTSASRMEKEMRLTLNKMQAATARIEAREKALSLIERMPTAPAPTPALVAETEADAPVVE